ncbi:MAG: DUF4926 domain-containing protein [Chlorobi bacterium]|nr:DUF4926 domain-containing protein [Chlorobiota bacterium]MCI0714723.1 DUF4926 domain-containing protein [Chlorobiota bacterium]
MKELDKIVLNKDIPEYNLKKGDIGTVVMIHNGGEGYEVEFMTLDGDTVSVETLKSSDIRKIRKREIAHVRVL